METLEGIFLDGVWIPAEQLWCYWCDRPCHDCACHLDPNGLPAGHWSKEAKP